MMDELVSTSGRGRLGWQVYKQAQTGLKDHQEGRKREGMMDTTQGGDNILAASQFLIAQCPLSGVLLGYHHTLTAPKIPLLSPCQTPTC